MFVDIVYSIETMRPKKKIVTLLLEKQSCNIYVIVIQSLQICNENKIATL